MPTRAALLSTALPTTRFFCASDMMTACFPSNFASFIFLRNISPPRSGGRLVWALWIGPNPASLRQRCWRLIRLLNVPDEKEPVSLMTHGFNVLSSKCFKQTDIISITLNTSGVPLTFQGKVGSREDEVAILAIITIASGDVMPLVMAGTETMTVFDRAGNSVISWIKQPYQVAEDALRQGSLANTTTVQVQRALFWPPNLPGGICMVLLLRLSPFDSA